MRWCRGDVIAPRSRSTPWRAAVALLDRTDAVPPTLRFAYELEDSLEAKLRAVARKVYGTDDVVLTPQAHEDFTAAAELGGAALPVCVAKTHLSLTDDPARLGHPRDFAVTVREVRLAVGAGFLVALTGDVVTMPGLPRVPAVRRITVREDGSVGGLMQGE
jgi:formate--tetrahydrofolate ligase